jgi:hypothetical protein
MKLINNASEGPWRDVRNQIIKRGDHSVCNQVRLSVHTPIGDQTYGLVWNQIRINRSVVSE